MSEWSCGLTNTGELRGRTPPMFPNRLDLKYIISGNMFSFTPVAPFSQWTRPIILGTFTVVLRMTLQFDTRLEFAQPGARGPISLLSGHLGFEDARLVSSLDGVPLAGDLIAQKLRAGERKLNESTTPLSSDEFGLPDTNQKIHDKANGLRQVFQNEDTQIPYLGLRAALRGSDFVMVFSKGARPAVPLSTCNCTSKCEMRIHCTCAGVTVLRDDERVLMQRLMSGGTWAVSGISEPGAWWVDGKALGASDGEVVTVRFCTMNQWGRRCGENVSFGFEDVGACFSSDPTPTPSCPPGMRVCPGHGCILPSMACAFER